MSLTRYVLGSFSTLYESTHYHTHQHLLKGTLAWVYSSLRIRTHRVSLGTPLRGIVKYYSVVGRSGKSSVLSKPCISGRSSAKPGNKFESYPSFRFQWSVTLHPDSMNRTLSSQGRGSITGHFLGLWICTMRYQLQSASTMLQWLSGMAAILMPFNVDPITHPAELNKMILSLTSLITQSYFKTWN